MGLIKNIILKNGVKTKYHRIGDAVLDNKNKKIKISVISYTDIDFRNQEKENQKKQDKHEQLIDLIMKENQKEESEKNVEQIVLWSDEANSIIGQFTQNLDLSVLKIELEYENITDISMNNLYSLIKEEELFKDSENI